jgi:hypothetical protein
MSGFLVHSGQVQVSITDTTEGPLERELVAGAGIALTVINPGGDEKLRIDANGPIPGGPAGGDLSGLYPNPTVANIQGDAVSTAPPSDGYALVWDAVSSSWIASTTLGGVNLPVMTDDTREATGFKDWNETTISLSVRTLTIQPAPGYSSFRYYLNGRRITVSSALTATFPDVVGVYWFYMNDSGGLVVESSSTFTFPTRHPIVALTYWNGAENLGLAEERHGISMDNATHDYLHTTVGTRYRSGLTATVNMTGTGATDDNAKIQISSGIIQDEDNSISIAHKDIPVAGDIFQQPLGVSNPIAGYVVGTKTVQLTNPQSFTVGDKVTIFTSGGVFRHEDTVDSQPDTTHIILVTGNGSIIATDVARTYVKIPVLYIDGASSLWLKQAFTATNYDFPFTVGATPLAHYNQFTGGAWTRTEVASGDFVAYWIFATNTHTYPIISIMGQRTDTTLIDAQNNNTFESLVFANLPFTEMKLLYRLIFETDVAYTNTVNTRLQDVVDFRSVSNLPSGTYVATEHAALTGLDYASSAHTGFGRISFESALMPSATNDAVDTAGVGRLFRNGDLWLYTVSKTHYICVDSTATAAVWKNIQAFGANNYVQYYADGYFSGSSAFQFNPATYAINSNFARNLLTTDVAGFSLTNTTLSTVVNTVQYSPLIKIGGTAWKSDAVAASQTQDWALQVRPATGAASTTSILHFLWSDNGAAWSSRVNIDSIGNVSVVGLYTTGVVSVWSSAMLLYGAVDLSTGLGAAVTLFSQSASPFVMKSLRTDGANNIVSATCYDRNAASITNAATMRIHSFGWTNNADTFIELAYVRADGAFVCATGSLSIGIQPAGLATDFGIATTVNTDTLSLWGVRASGAGNVSVAVVADVNAVSISATHKILSIQWVNNIDVATEVAYVYADGYLHTEAGFDASKAWGIAAVSTAGLTLANTTLATVGVPIQYSPALQLSGTAYDTDGSVSVTEKWRIESRPVSGAVVSSELQFLHAQGVGAFASAGSLSSAGAFAATTAVFATSVDASGIRLGVSDLATGLGATLYMRTLAGDYPMALVHLNRTDGVSNIVIASVYDRNAASITNAATMRIHSFGWTNSADAFTELAYVRADGAFVCATGSLSTGILPAGMATDFGMATTVTTDTLSLWGVRANGSGNISNAIVADVNNATLHADHKVLSIGWVNNADVYTELFAFKDGQIVYSNITGGMEFWSDEADGGSVVAFTVGSTASWVTPGAKLFSVVNGDPAGYERAYIDAYGDFCINKRNNEQCLEVKSLTEVYIVPAAADGYSTIQLPANSLIVGLSAYVTVTIPTAATFDIGITLDQTKYATGVNVAAGTQSVALSNAIHYNTSALSVLFTPSATPAAATGRVRLTIYYIALVAPTS